LISSCFWKIVEQCSRQGDPLTQPLGQRSVQVTGAVFKIDRPQRTFDAPANVAQLKSPAKH
jgi:hypothetical protein